MVFAMFESPLLTSLNMNGLGFDLELKLVMVCVLTLHIGGVMIDWITLQVFLRLSLVNYCYDSDSWYGYDCS